MTDSLVPQPVPIAFLFFGGSLMSRVVLAVVLAGLWAVQGHAPHPEDVSLVELIADPAKFDGKVVVVHGFLQIDYEHDMLFLHREDFDNVLLENAIWVDTTEEMGRNRAKLNSKYV